MSPEPGCRLLTVDVEDWRRGLGGAPPPGDSHLERAVALFLDALASMNARATFFVLGEDAPPLGRLLRRAAAEGHEIACHGMSHQRPGTMAREVFRRDVSRARALLEDLSGSPCRGYRAPWFSLQPHAAWAFRVLAGEGFHYDASLRLPSGAPTPEAVAAAGLVEVPVPLGSLLGCRLGVLGGTALRLLPPGTVASLLARHPSACIHLHPYEWLAAPGAPRGLSPTALRRRLLVGLTIPRLERLARKFPLLSIAQGELAQREPGPA